MPAGLGGGGYVAVTFETTMGTYLPPTTAGTVFVPILSESLKYVEDKYYSKQIRQQTVESDVKSGYYHVEGDVVLEADVNYLPYFMYASRHTITKTGAGTPWVYKYTPSQAGAASTGTGPTTARSVSITVVRNGVGFGYAGCQVNTTEWTIDNGILRVSLGILGLSETTPGGLGTPTWIAPSLFGADAHSIFVAAAAVTPTWGSASVDFNGFTFRTNYNAAAQNRINALRSAAYISFGETEATYETELDFINKTEYDNFKAATVRAIRLLSVKGGVTLTLATEGVQIDTNRSAYETYDLGLAGMGDLIMAGVTGRALGIAGGDPYAISIKSPVDIT